MVIDKHDCIKLTEFNQLNSVNLNSTQDTRVKTVGYEIRGGSWS